MCHGKEALRLVNGPLVCASRQKVLRQASLVGAPDALDPNIVVVCALQGAGERGAGGDALQDAVSGSCAIDGGMGVWAGGRASLTMLPGSVDPRAKMRMAVGQLLELPLSRSLREVVWRDSRAWVSAPSRGAAMAEARRPRVLRMVLSFILLLGRINSTTRQSLGGYRWKGEPGLSRSIRGRYGWKRKYRQLYTRGRDSRCYHLRYAPFSSYFSEALS